MTKHITFLVAEVDPVGLTLIIKRLDDGGIPTFGLPSSVKCYVFSKWPVTVLTALL